ncbi:hypothetical protein EDC04DRAFT_2607604 [Pisolithus marmoratus]|nr:hypothetical protein EDC04DRAFT_2607604 [Pisolithus marmoratus]
MYGEADASLLRRRGSKDASRPLLKLWAHSLWTYGSCTLGFMECCIKYSRLQGQDRAKHTKVFEESNQHKTPLKLGCRLLGAVVPLISSIKLKGSIRMNSDIRKEQRSGEDNQRLTNPFEVLSDAKWHYEDESAPIYLIQSFEIALEGTQLSATTLTDAGLLLSSPPQKGDSRLSKGHCRVTKGTLSAQSFEPSFEPLLSLPETLETLKSPLEPIESSVNLLMTLDPFEKASCLIRYQGPLSTSQANQKYSQYSITCSQMT